MREDALQSTEEPRLEFARGRVASEFGFSVAKERVRPPWLVELAPFGTEDEVETLLPGTDPGMIMRQVSQHGLQRKKIPHVEHARSGERDERAPFDLQSIGVEKHDAARGPVFPS